MEKDIFKKNKKTTIIFRVVVILIALFILIASIVKVASAVTNFFESKTIVFHNPIDLSVYWPMEVITRQEQQRREEFDKKTDWIADECVNLMLAGLTGTPTPTPTPEPKKSSGLIKPVEAKSNYTYQEYEDAPFYQEIISWLQKEYIAWEDAAELIARESSFIPDNINPVSHSCGLAQAYPCEKMNCDLLDIDCQLSWQKEYVSNRYGTISKALSFQITEGWY